MLRFPERRAFGIDRISLSFPVRDYAAPSAWSTHSHSYADGSDTLSTVVRGEGQHEGASVMVGVKVVRGKPWAKVEANPSRFADPKGCSLMPVREWAQAVTVMHAVASQWVEPSVQLEDAKVRRLDVARDFRGVTLPGIYVRGLLNVKRPHARRSSVWSDPSRGNAETLWVGSGAGGVRLYDQHEAYAEKGAPEGSLRWEVEARRDWCEKSGMTTVNDVDTVAIEAMAQKRWEWSAMGTQVTGAANVVDVVTAMVRQGEISMAVGQRLIGCLVMESLGTAPQQSNDAAARYNELKRRIGVVPSAELFGQALDVEVCGRLDFDSGTEVIAA